MVVFGNKSVIAATENRTNLSKSQLTTEVEVGRFLYFDYCP